MAQSLTRSYADLFHESGSNSAKLGRFVRSAGPFVLDAYSSGKLRELTSFALWEVQHRAGGFSPEQYLQFEDTTGAELRRPTSDLPKELNRALGGELRVEASPHVWSLLFDGPDVAYGVLNSEPNVLYVTTSRGVAVHGIWEFSDRVKTLFVSSEGTVFVATSGGLYRIGRGNRAFRRSLAFSHPESRPLFPHGITETPDGAIVVGEYGSVRQAGKWRSVANVYLTRDGGQTWDRSERFIESGANKHIHLVHYSPIHRKLIVTDGDNLKRLWLGDWREGMTLDQVSWKLVTKRHLEKGGYTSVADVGDTTLLGSDYLGGTNFIVQTKDCKTFTSHILPDPYRRSPVMRLASRRSRSGNVETWALLHSSIASSQRCLLMYSTNQGQSWRKVIDYDGTKFQVRISNAGPSAPARLWFSVIDASGPQTAFCICDG